MKRVFISLIIIISLTFLYCETYVSGGTYSTSETWTVQNHPYIVQGDVTFSSETTLTIEPGVLVKFGEDTSLTVLGQMIADGGAFNKITFDSYVTGEKWGGVHLVGSSLSSFEYCNISNSNNGGINISRSNAITISNCSIHDNTSNRGAGIYIDRNCTNILIENSSIYNNEGNFVQNEMEGGSGIACTSSDFITIDSNEIYSNKGGYNGVFSGGGIRVYDSDYVSIINNSNISYNEVFVSPGGGINISEGENNVISNNNIHHNNALNSDGGGIYLWTPASITDNDIHHNNAHRGAGIYGDEMVMEFADYQFDDNDIHHNIATNGGGGALFGGSTIEACRMRINRCNIYSNETTVYNGGGILICMRMNVEMAHCNIYDNVADFPNACGGGVYVGNASLILSKSVVRNNVSYRGGALFLSDTVPCGYDPVCTVENCVIAENNATSLGGGIFVQSEEDGVVSNIECYNNIFANNSGTCGQDLYIQCFGANIYYSNVKYNRFDQNGFIVTNSYLNLVSVEGNIEADPKCTNLDDYDYYLLPDSPCIDTGHPNWPPDPDGTRADMGVIPFDHDEDIKFFHADYNWISFPRLPMMSAVNTNQPVTADNIVDILVPGLPDYFELLHLSNVYPVLLYEYENWLPNDPDEYDLFSSNGYKLKTKDPENTEISIDGLRLEPDTAIDLQYGENWIGYWLTESQNIDDAFGEEHFEKIVSVKAEDWEWRDMSIQRGMEPHPMYYPMRALEYGKGYIIRLREAIQGFQWQTGAPVLVEEIPEPENFEFNELADYETIVIDTIEGGGNITEVGAFIDDVCVGAAVVTHYPVQVLTYVDGVSRSPELTFQVVTGQRGAKHQVDYTTLNLNTGLFENMSCILGRFNHNIIKLNLTESIEPEEQPVPSSCKLDGNYPNPFNPETKISFSLPTEQKIELTVYNLKGQKVRQLIKGDFIPGQHSVVWNGKDDNGKHVGSGLYFYKLKTHDKEISKKMLLLK